MDTKWPDLVNEFCFTKPICREAPGERVSVAYGKRSEKFIRQFSIKDIHKLFKLKYPDFDYKLSTFHKLIPKNLVKPSMRDVKQNICRLHENVKRSVKAFNRFAKKNKLMNLALPSSTLDICLQFICNPNIADADKNRNPLNWHPECTKRDCTNCKGSQWFVDLAKTIEDDENLEKKDITYSQWVMEREAKQTRQVLRQQKTNILSFINTVLFKALWEKKFPEHLCKAWNQ